MNKKLKILLLEDSRDDITLIERELARSGLDVEFVIAGNKREFTAALDQHQPDVILADHSLPDFNSIEAFAMYKDRAQQTGVTIPFILVTGNVSEEFAIQSIKAGVDDYILKDSLKRLPTAIESALEKARFENERKRYLEQVITKEALMSEAEQLASFGSWQVDLRANKHTWSDATYAIYGYKPGEIEPDYETFLGFVHPDDRDALRATLESLMVEGESMAMEFRIIDAKGITKYLGCRLKIERNEQGEPVRVMGFNLDITEKKMAAIALEREEQKYKSLFHQNPEAVFSIDLDWRFTNVNESFTRIVALRGEDVIGKDFRSVLKSDHLINIYQDLISGRRAGRQRYETSFVNRLGKVFTLDVTVMGMVVDGKINGVHCIGNDISERRRLEVLLDEAYRAARIGGWEIDLESDIVSWTAITRELHEVSDNFEPSIEANLSFYRNNCRETMRKALANCINAGMPWDLELQIVTARTNVRWVRTIGHPEFKNGKCTRVYGTIQDIDDRKSAEERSKEANKEKITILESIGDGFFAVDKNWIVTYWNNVAESMSRVSRDRVLGRNLWTVFPEAVMLEAYNKVQHAMQDDVAVYFEEYYPQLSSWFLVNVYPSSTGLSVYFKDITEQKKHVTEIEQQNKMLREIARIQSHEVRAPLARLMGLVNLINEGQYEDRELPELLARLEISAGELDTLIRQIVRKTESLNTNQIL